MLEILQEKRRERVTTSLFERKGKECDEEAAEAINTEMGSPILAALSWTWPLP